MAVPTAYSQVQKEKRITQQSDIEILGDRRKPNLNIEQHVIKLEKTF